MLKRFWEGWKRFGHWMGDMVARVVLTIFYFTIFLPFGLAVRLFSDPLAIKEAPADFWLARSTHDKTIADTRRQF
jgi:hypothetical protein